MAGATVAGVHRTGQPGQAVMQDWKEQWGERKEVLRATVLAPRRRSCLQHDPPATSSAFPLTRPMSNAGSLVSVQGPRGRSMWDREGQRQAVSIREEESMDSRSAVSPVLCCQGPPSRQEAE